MVKYIKFFENNFKIFENKLSQFKVGDFVYADNIKVGKTNGTTLVKDVKYEIIEVVPPTNWASYRYRLKEIPHEIFYEHRFISELEYNAKKYNI